ncbi:MAG: hypothetical protein CL946_08860 [Ectothiorhodospiraceae bacterium]|nr:hypothetical protein [Ectothiorhodospiraceae bacterium]
MEAYIHWVKENPLVSAAVQFGILGTIGEIIPYLLKKKTLKGFANPWEFIAKILAWALLGVIIKYGFTGMKGFVNNLLEHDLLPVFFAQGFGYAFAVSVITNVLFGPQMMLFHRVEDNLIMREWSFAGIENAIKTLIWFWIPAHTITFMLPGPFQIGLAAAWSIALGIILGFANTKKE